MAMSSIRTEKVLLVVTVLLFLVSSSAYSVYAARTSSEAAAAAPAPGGAAVLEPSSSSSSNKMVVDEIQGENCSRGCYAHYYCKQDCEKKGFTQGRCVDYRQGIIELYCCCE